MSKQARVQMLPRSVAPLKLAAAGANLAGECRLDDMLRLDLNLDGSASLAPVQAQLRFYRDAQGMSFAEGTVQAQLPRICQRCLAPMIEAVRCDLLWALAKDEAQADSMDATYEAVLRGDEPLALWEAVEDELLLAADLAPAHAQRADCNPERIDALRKEFTDSDKEAPHPFAGLRGLKRD